MKRNWIILFSDEQITFIRSLFDNKVDITQIDVRNEIKFWFEMCLAIQKTLYSDQFN